MTYAGVQMLMAKLNHLINPNDNPLFNHPSIICERPQFQRLYEELGSMIQTLYIDQHQDLEKVNDLKKRFTDAAEEAQYIVDLFLSRVHIRNSKLSTSDFNRCLHLDDVRRSIHYVVNLFIYCFCSKNDGHFPSLNLDDVRRSFNLVKVELTSMNTSRIHDATLNQSAAPAPVSVTRNSQESKKLLNEIVVGLDDDAGLIRDKLVEDRKKVDVVSIVGMGGIGKTTLATKVFLDDYVKYHFHIRVWLTISQTYNKRDVLIQIIESIRGQLHLENTGDSRLREMVHKHLMGKRYLIVIDDIWDIETWDNLKLFFPHNNNGSRILLTSRLTEVAKHANSDGLIHHIGHLNKERSWELLCQKVFHGNDQCPDWSIKPGMEIVESCQGLPLAVVVIAGVLAKEALSEKFWVEIAESTGSYIVGGQNGCMETLGLSYNHLPLQLRECFLYFGGFPEDYKIEVRMLIWLWVAERFIEEDGNRRLEDIADGYLMDLIDRNLVIVTGKRNFNGAVRYCKVHDLVRELCLKKAKEERFYNPTPTYKSTRMFIIKNIQNFRYPSVKNLRAILYFGEFKYLSDDIASGFYSFVLLRVLDLQKCELDDFPESMKLLVHLRYLAIWISLTDLPSSICNLWNLQTLIYHTSYGNLPSNISDLVNLRHLWTYGGVFLFPSIERPMKLQTILGVTLRDGIQNLQNKIPCIKELKFNAYSNEYYDLKSLTSLEKLKITGFVPNRTTFPATLKTLTLERCGLAWSDMSIIHRLPNLQVLKLKVDAFKGICWNTDGQEFPQLKFLRLWGLDIQRWEAYNTTFPCLRQLEIVWCEDLEEIPLEIGDIPTLELIKINSCRRSVGLSVGRIQDEHYEINIDISEDISDEELEINEFGCQFWSENMLGSHFVGEINERHF